jgi:hypothetical protein
MKSFKQPPGKPSVLAYFNCYLKLNQVLAFTLRTIVRFYFKVSTLSNSCVADDNSYNPYLPQYSINKSKILLGFVGQQWEQHIVAELDSALNKWIDSVPDHRMQFLPYISHPLTSFVIQFDGIRIGKTMYSSVNQRPSMQVTTTCKY